MDAMVSVNDQGVGQELVRAYLAAVEKFDVDAALACLAPDWQFTEMPNRLKPKGAARRIDGVRAGLPEGRRVLRQQTYAIGAVTGGGERVVVEARWEGTVAIPLGRLQPGDAMVAYVCMVFELEGGRIVRQRNYDCYEDFS